MRIPMVAAAVMAASLVYDCKADDKTPATAIPNDLSNYQGDRLSFNEDVVVTVQKADGTEGDKFCLPAHVKLRGGVGYSAPVKNNGKDSTETGTLFRLLQHQNLTESVEKKLPKEADGKAKPAALQAPAPLSFKHLAQVMGGTPQVAECSATSIPPTPAGGNPVKTDWYTLTPGVDLRVSKETLDRAPPNRYGLTYGLLAVPFKYHLSGAKEFTGSATIGPYFGYRTLNSGRGFGLSYIAFLGYSNISVTQTVNGESKTQNLASIGYGLGAVATVKGNFQLGAVLGFDRVSKDAGYQYNGKPWLAIELGYSFLQ